MDADKIHRWLTEAELSGMLDKAREEGCKATDEKLRALLAEALDQHAHCLPCVPDCVWTRIETALAEPVGVHPSSLTDVVTLLENERDEARAEVAAAYQRGAEAMREAAARYAERVRSLPIPEDKP